ncbi:glutathione S-transferase [Pseudomonadota bacterium]
MSHPPILYSFRRCPYAIRARLAVKASGVQVVLREVKLADKPPSLFEYSAKATVPVLVLPDKTVIDESRDVMRWALAQHDPASWLPKDEKETEQVNSLIDWNDGAFKQHLDRYKYADRYPEHPMTYYRQQAEEFIAELETRLKHSRYLGGDCFSLADAAIFPFIRQFAHVDKHWFDQTEYSHLQAWLETLLKWPLFLSVMDKYAPWRAGDDPTVF